MAGYSRQDDNNNIATGKVINASDFDNDFIRRAYRVYGDFG